MFSHTSPLVPLFWKIHFGALRRNAEVKNHYLIGRATYLLSCIFVNENAFSIPLIVWWKHYYTTATSENKPVEVVFVIVGSTSVVSSMHLELFSMLCRY